MQWLEVLVSLFAAADFVIAAMSCLYLFQFARETASPSRRVGALALTLVCAALALEAVLFLSQAPMERSLTRSAAVLFVRGALLLSATFVGALIWRNSRA